MPTDAIQELNARFAIPDHVSFAADPGGLPVATVHNHHAGATIALRGGNVVAFQPHGAAPVLWVSRQAVYTEGKAIRGGIPLCWPWFGPHPTDPSKPDHGFVRARPWTVTGTAVADHRATRVSLELTDSADTRALWPHAFALELVVVVGPALRVTLVARNTGPDPFVCGGALHSYFSVGDVTTVAIHGLEGRAYVDKVDGGRSKIQQGPITITGETDRVYQETTAACVIDNPALGRGITVDKAGSCSTVVWNPWRDKARRLADFGDDEYPQMICVEVANAPGDTATVPPGGEHRLRTTIGVD